MKVLIAFFLLGGVFALDVSAQTQGKAAVEEKAAASSGKTAVGSAGTTADGTGAGGTAATAVTVGAAAASIIAVAFGKSVPVPQRKPGP
jgi:CDP-diglyceride synthetase